MKRKSILLITFAVLVTVAVTGFMWVYYGNSLKNGTMLSAEDKQAFDAAVEKVHGDLEDIAAREDFEFIELDNPMGRSLTSTGKAYSLTLSETVDLTISVSPPADLKAMLDNVKNINEDDKAKLPNVDIRLTSTNDEAYPCQLEIRATGYFPS